MKSISSMLAGLLAVTLLLGCGGCNVTDEAQIKAISQQAGMWAAVGWIALDNPSSEQISVVRGLMTEIESGATNVVAGKTYTEVLYPALIAYINKDVDPQYRPLAKTGVLSALNGLDLLFVTNPNWRKNEQLALKVVDAFIKGASNGLSLKENDPVMQQARTAGAARVRVFQEVRAQKLINELRSMGAQ